MLLAAFVPIPPIVVRLWQPALIDINNMMTLAVQLEHLLSVQETAYSVVLRVPAIADPFDATVAQLKLLLHRGQNSPI